MRKDYFGGKKDSGKKENTSNKVGKRSFHLALIVEK